MSRSLARTETTHRYVFSESFLTEPFEVDDLLVSIGLEKFVEEVVPQHLGDLILCVVVDALSLVLQLTTNETTHPRVPKAAKYRGLCSAGSRRGESATQGRLLIEILVAPRSSTRRSLSRSNKKRYSLSVRETRVFAAGFVSFFFECNVIVMAS